MNISDVRGTFMRIVGDSSTPNKVVEDKEDASFAMIEKDNYAGEIDEKTAYIIKKQLEFRGNVKESAKGYYWLIYSKPSDFRLGDIVS